jgi:hypothetical protein
LAVVAALLASVAASACAGGSPGPKPIPEHPDLTGTWLLNPGASEDPENDAPRMPAPSGGPPSPSRTRTPAATQSFLPSVAFRIQEADSLLIFSDAQGRERAVFQDGREFIEPVEGLGNVTVTARWKGDKLVLERQLESGARITETYELKLDGRQLHIEITILTRRTIEFLRVYDRGDAF